jgi:large subunit ribosomal protein L6
MSRIGQKPIEIPAGVTVTVANGVVTVKGKLGELRLDLPKIISAEVVDGKQVKVSRPGDSRQEKSFHGLTRTLIANMLVGVAQGYSKALEIEGVGYKASIQGPNLMLSLGFATPVTYAIPAGIKVTEEGGTKLVVSGSDKQKVGDAAARIRGFYPVEPYKGKGIRYKDEHVRRKEGKTVA